MRRWRRDKGVTLDRLADEVGVTASFLSMVENHKRTPSLDLTVKLSRATADDNSPPVVTVQEIADACMRETAA
jgi:transcriptional regulator with XRE-family HTH domain